ncbi:YqaJ viral recombinase family protein, partial [Enterocloster hominis (ex Hitch et al. 2024)]
RSKEHPCMLADLDRLVVGKDAGLECKTASAYNADKWKDGEIPPHYLIQCHHYMAVTGKKSWYIAVVILGQGFKYAEIPRDDALIDDLIRIEEKFWEGNVIPGIMPPPDGSRACDEVLEEYFRISRKNSEIPLIGFDEKLKRRMELEELIKKMERDQKQIDQEIKLYMKDHEAAVSDRYRVTWASVETGRLDTKRIKAERPDVYEDFLNVTSSRRFTVKAA